MSPNDLLPGTRVGDDYRIIQPLARGGMGAVYVALQESTNKRRALKVMTPQPGDVDSLRRRFEHEARISAQIESDHVIQIIGAGVDRDTNLPWLAMELLEGETLEARLERGPLGWKDAWNVVDELCHGLDAAHRLGVVHRDLKPTNVFLARSWRPGAERIVKILDFGIAKRVGDTGETVGMLGTPLFMAPEQTAPGVALLPSTDVWALGLLVFTMLTGASYWRSARLDDAQLGVTLREIVLDPLPPASERARELGIAERLPAGFDAWFARCVVRDPAARFASAGEAYRALVPVFAAATGWTADGAMPAARGMAAHPTPMGSGREKESLAPISMETGSVDRRGDTGLDAGPVYETTYDERFSDPVVVPRSRLAAKVFGALLVGGAAAAFAAVTILRQPDGVVLRSHDERAAAGQQAVAPMASPVATSDAAADAPQVAPAAPAAEPRVDPAPAAIEPAPPADGAAATDTKEAEAPAAAAPKTTPRRVARPAPRRAPPRPAPTPEPTPEPAPPEPATEPAPPPTSDFPYPEASEPPDAAPRDPEPAPVEPEPAAPYEPSEPGRYDPGTL